MVKRLIATSDDLLAGMTRFHESMIGNSGRIVDGVRCPSCGLRVIYNGNYFCEEFGGIVTQAIEFNGIRGYERIRFGGVCDWALDTNPAVTKKDREMCRRLNIGYE